MEERNNREAFEYAKKFVNNELLAMFKQVENKSGKCAGYGPLIHSPDGKIKAVFHFYDGICLRCEDYMEGKDNTFINSVKFWK